MRSVLRAIHRVAENDPLRPAITGLGETLTYGELECAILRTQAALADSPQTVGLLMGRSSRAIITDLALAALGRTIVPLPDFFTDDQWRHIIDDAGIGAVVTEPDLAERLEDAPVPVLVARPGLNGVVAGAAASASRRIIYTSGTTGRPKGVMLDEAAMAVSLNGLEKRAEATASDINLSALPFSLLLEQLAGVLLPLKVGARIHLAASPAELPLEAELVHPTTSILVPDQLAGWVGFLRQIGRRAPESLRFVAVGGAPVGTALGEAAWSLGLPIHEGYGLSECCSVVAVNGPGTRQAGTVGRPLDGVEVDIEDGEIVVRGPTVMSGYLGGPSPEGVWRTGDLGEWDDSGNLVVLGRKDDVVVTQAGRNVHPEWIEPMLLSDPGVRRAAVVAGRRGLKAVLMVDAGTPEEWLPRAQALTAAAPAYARPAEVALLSADDARRHALFTPDGRPRRRRIAQLMQEVQMNFYEALVEATTPERKAFMSIPLIREAIAEGVERPLYLAFLNCAYHHVRYTVPLFEAALGVCGPDDATLVAGLEEYIEEERGHEGWILDDIEALGGDRAASRDGRPPLAVRAMVAYAFHLIAEEGPYSVLGMAHVLEGMAVALADKAAHAIRARLAVPEGTGFSYLISHGAVDIGHVEEFAKLVNALDTPDRRATVIAAAKDFYRLYGNMFRSLEAEREALSHAA